MKTFTLLAVTGGLFFASLCLDSKHVKKTAVLSKNNVKHCMKKSCSSAKKCKAGNMNISGKAVNSRG